MIIHALEIQLDSFMLKKMELLYNRALIIFSYYRTYVDNYGELRLSFDTGMDAKTFYKRVQKGFDEKKKEIFITDITPRFSKEAYHEYIEEEIMCMRGETCFLFDDL